jgi:hypothetical protein
MPRIFIVIIALLTGLTFFTGSTASFAMAAQTQAPKKQSWKKPHSKKKKG